MAKPTHQAYGPSQRSSRVGKLMTHVLLLLTLPTPVLGEVCDKAVGESWLPEHGPVWLLNPVGFPFALVVLIGWLVLAGMSKSVWPGIIGAALLSLPVALGVADALTPDTEASDMWLAMLKEGCVSTRTQLMGTGVAAVFALAYALLGLRARYHRAETV
jgi:hypothetical protein